MSSSNALSTGTPRESDAESYTTLRTIFVEASASMRHYSGLQFAIQTLYLASVGALGSAAFLSERAIIPVGLAPLTVWAAGALVAISILFLLLTLSCERHREHFRMRAHDLECKLLHETTEGVPRTPFIGATAALKWFYTMSLALWLVALLWMIWFPQSGS